MVEIIQSVPPPPRGPEWTREELKESAPFRGDKDPAMVPWFTAWLRLTGLAMAMLTPPHPVLL